MPELEKGPFDLIVEGRRRDLSRCLELLHNGLRRPGELVVVQYDRIVELLVAGSMNFQ